MHTIFHDAIVAQRVTDMHREAAKQRLLRELRASHKPGVRRRRIWERLTVRRQRPATQTPSVPISVRCTDLPAPRHPDTLTRVNGLTARPR